jgi:translation initiation factor RLI1
MLEDEMKALIKIQYVDSVAKAKGVATAVVGKRLKALDAQNLYDDAVRMLDLESILER